MTGVDETLPDTYGLPHDGLAELLDEARERFATEHGISPSERADRALLAEAARVRQDRVPMVTGLLAVACIALFASEVQRYGVFPDVQELLDAGGVSQDALADGRWWTLLSANVLHANPIHLVLNLVALALIGTLLERELGWAHFGAVCLAGAAGAMGLAVLLQPATVVVGVSGVIFALAARALMRDPHRTRALGVVAWSIVPVGVIYTFLTPHVSIGAHLGGLLTGLALGYAFERRAPRGHAAPSV
jgi:membrane associated rhomboid family serine protease